jgi:hypothetical protein
MARLLSIGCVALAALAFSACGGSSQGDQAARTRASTAPTRTAPRPHKRRAKPHLRRQFHRSPPRQLEPWISTHCPPHRPCHHHRYLGGIFEGDGISEDILQTRRRPFLQIFGPPKPVAPKNRDHRGCLYYDEVNRHGRTDGWGWEFCFNRRGRMTQAAGLYPTDNPPVAG